MFIIIHCNESDFVSPLEPLRLRVIQAPHIAPVTEGGVTEDEKSGVAQIMR